VFRIEFIGGALGDLDYFRKAEQAIIMRRIEASLVDQPSVETRQRKPCGQTTCQFVNYGSEIFLSSTALICNWE
jgi:hypothetical protein